MANVSSQGPMGHEGLNLGFADRLCLHLATPDPAVAFRWLGMPKLARKQLSLAVEEPRQSWAFDSSVSSLIRQRTMFSPRECPQFLYNR